MAEQKQLHTRRVENDFGQSDVQQQHTHTRRRRRRQAAAAAGGGVGLRSPSQADCGEMLKEAMASGRALIEAKSDPGASDLAKAVVADMETPEGRTVAREELKAELAGKTPAELKSQVVATLTKGWPTPRRQGARRRACLQRLAEAHCRQSGGSRFRRRLSGLWRC